MPSYTVRELSTLPKTSYADAYTFHKFNHAIPLSRQQKDVLAEFITDLHATTFVAPRFFVNVFFNHTKPGVQVYAAGKLRGNQLPNHVLATIRVGPSRTKDILDTVAIKLHTKWLEVVDDVALGAHSFGHLPTKEERLLKKLQVIAFQPALAALEYGIPIPEVH
jgi:phenylpyruvate tautomerase PptA (4-oxalocrotonate tautomerase family)